VQAAGRYLERVKEGHRVLHIVSDFRRRDWAEASAEELHGLLAEMSRVGKVRVRLHDVASPERGPNLAETPPAHPNVGLTDATAKPRRRADVTAAPSALADLPLRVVTPRLPFDLHATIRNFADVERRGLRLA